MKPQLYAGSSDVTAPGVSQLTECSSPRLDQQPTHVWPTDRAENKSPYPGIYVGSASELLDFRFTETEML